MLSSSRTLFKLSLVFWPRKLAPFRGVTSQNHFLYASFCSNIVEPPELPDWLKNIEDDKLSVNGRVDDDDSVLPEIVKRAKPIKVPAHSRKQKAAEIEDDKLSVNGRVDDDDDSVLPEIVKWAEPIKVPAHSRKQKAAEIKDDKLSVNGHVDDDDDPVLPEIVKWAEPIKVPAHSRKQKAAEIVDNNLNKISEILTGKFKSLDSVSDALSECDNIRLSESLVEQVLLKFRHDWIISFGFFNWAKDQVKYYKHSAKCYDMMVDILGRSRNFYYMWELVEEMNELGGLVSFATMTKVMKRLANFGKYNEAVDAFDKFETFGVIRETPAMNMLMDLLVKGKNVEGAHKVYLEYKDKIKPNDVTFKILIHGCCKAKLFKEARKVMEDREKHGHQNDVVSYTWFIEFYCRDKNFKKVDEILDEMDNIGCPPNVVTYTIIMHALGEAKEINRALKIYDKMKQDQCVPDSSFYSALIYTLSTSGKFKDACDVFKEIPHDVSDVLTYNSMIAAACSHSKEEYALGLLKEMEKKKSCKPNLNTYIPLLKMCCEKKRMKVLYYVLDEMFKKNVVLDLSTHCLIVDQICKSGKLEHACFFFKQLLKRGMVPMDKTYTLLIGKLEQNGMDNAKRRIEKRMLKAKK